MDEEPKGTYRLSKITPVGRFEVRFVIQSDGTVNYATIENRKVTYSGKLKSWKEAAASWDRLVANGYHKVIEDL